MCLCIHNVYSLHFLFTDFHWMQPQYFTIYSTMLLVIYRRSLDSRRHFPERRRECAEEATRRWLLFGQRPFFADNIQETHRHTLTVSSTKPQKSKTPVRTKRDVWIERWVRSSYSLSRFGCEGGWFRRVDILYVVHFWHALDFSLVSNVDSWTFKVHYNCAKTGKTSIENLVGLML